MLFERVPEGRGRVRHMECYLGHVRASAFLSSECTHMAHMGSESTYSKSDRATAARDCQANLTLKPRLLSSPTPSLLMLFTVIAIFNVQL